MDGLPQPDKFLKMVCRSMQYLPHVRPLRIRWPDRVVAVRPSNSPIHPQIDDYLRFTSKAVNMTRRMIVQIGNEPNAARP
jgi:hypothetical protein